MSKQPSGGPSAAPKQVVILNLEEPLKLLIFSRLNKDNTVLTLEDNNIGSLPENLFHPECTLTQLRLSGNLLCSLPPNIFVPLKHLKTLDLSKNTICSLPPNIFQNLTQLERLALGNNKLSSLPSNIFDNLMQLKDLILEHNLLSCLPNNIFDNLTRLQDLDLSRNVFLSSLPLSINRLTQLKRLTLGGLLCHKYEHRNAAGWSSTSAKLLSDEHKPVVPPAMIVVPPVRSIVALRPVVAPPVHSFSTSNFKALYASSKAPEYLDEVFFSLRTFLREYCKWKGIEQHKCDAFFNDLQREVLADKPDKAIWICTKLWTSAKGLNDREFCSLVNETIREDNEQVLKCVLPIISGLNELCVVSRGPNPNPFKVAWPPNYMLYRGAGLPDVHQSQFVVGHKYRCPMYIATSKSKDISQHFFCRRAQFDYNFPPVLYTFHLDSKFACKHVNYVENKDNPEEDEFLFVPYSVFIVKRVDWRASPNWMDPHDVELEVAVDNRLESEDLPLIKWH